MLPSFDDLSPFFIVVAPSLGGLCLFIAVTQQFLVEGESAARN